MHGPTEPDELSLAIDGNGSGSCYLAHFWKNEKKTKKNKKQINIWYRQIYVLVIYARHSSLILSSMCGFDVNILIAPLQKEVIDFPLILEERIPNAVPSSVKKRNISELLKSDIKLNYLDMLALLLEPCFCLDGIGISMICML